MLFGVVEMAKSRLTFNIDEDVKIRIQHLALDKKTTITDLCVEWITDALEKETGQTKLEVE